MGYTHYWRNTPNLTPQVVQDIKAILAKSPVPLAGPMGTGDPIVSPDEVRLNGAYMDRYETFALYPDQSSDFCKTEKRPYDVVVTAVLLRMAEEGMTVTSDGDREDWEPGYQLFEQALGRQVLHSDTLSV